MNITKDAGNGGPWEWRPDTYSVICMLVLSAKLQKLFTYIKYRLEVVIVSRGDNNAGFDWLYYDYTGD